MTKKLKIAASPLTGTIYAGVPKREGEWGKEKQDVTHDCYNAVAQSMIHQDMRMEFTMEGKDYVMEPVEVPQPKQINENED